MAGKYDFVIEQGATFDRSLTYKDPAGTPLNLTGYTARMQIRSGVSSPTVLLELTSANGRLVIDPLVGGITIYLEPVDTEGVMWKRGVYDLEIEAPDTSVTRLIEGNIELSREVTR